MRYSFTRLTLPAACVAALALPVSSLHAQGNAGTVSITVQDASGAAIPGAKLDLVEKSSNSPRSAVSDGKGLHNFIDLNIGTYKLTITHEGFQTKVYENVLVESSTTTPLAVVLPAGQVTETVNVTTQANAVLQTSSTEIGSVINMTEIENLPVGGRDIQSLARLSAGYNGTWNGLPDTAQGTNIDGAIGNNGRTKYQGTIATTISPRIESFEQISVVTDGLSLGNGFGTATMQVNYVSRRGSNKFHGRAYYDFRNDGLNANSWANDSTVNSAGQWAPTRKSKLIQHDFGGSIGGPILKDKLFFFGTYAEFKQPGTQNVTNTIFPASSLAGNFTYTTSANNQTFTHTVNVFQLAAAYNRYNGSAGTAGSPFPNVNPNVGALLQNAITATQGLPLTTGTDPTIQTVNFSAPSTQTQYYPVARLDYNATDKVRMYLSWIMNQSNPVGSYAAPFPGAAYANQAGNNFTRNFQLNYGLDYIINPRLINQFKVGFLYSKQLFAATAAPNYLTNPVVLFNMTGANASQSGMNYTLPTGYEYPLFSLSDNVTYEKGSHSINFGFQGYREQDHYYNAPQGFPKISFGLSSQDPAVNAFTYPTTVTAAGGTLPNGNSTVAAEAGQLFAVLTGRISSVAGNQGYNAQTQSYQPQSFNLDEVALSSGVWAQDSWKMHRTFTLNYGLRWDFVVDPHDIKSAYHNTLLDSILGPTAQSNLFQPGALGGNLNPAISLNPRPIKGFYNTPQPQVAFNWNPDPEKGTMLDRLLNGRSTVIRAGFGLRHFTEPNQFYWDAASSLGALYNQNFGFTANTTGATGTFTPGSLNYGDCTFRVADTCKVPGTGQAVTPAFSPTVFPINAPISSFTFSAAGQQTVEGIKANIHMPYVESWNLGIQRALSRTTVLEIRYNGNRTVHAWNTYNYNEVNTIENGFLQDFKNAQANYAASGNKTIQGALPMPIINAAFANSPSSYTNSTFTGYLINGAAGSFARQLAGNGGSTPTYFCSLVGKNFAPCAANANLNYAGAGYPINFFQANPYVPGSNTSYVTDGGYSNYNGLQIDVRQAGWHGLQGDVNYTYSKSLGFGTANNDYTSSSANVYTLRNLHYSYQPQSFDARNVLHGYGTYDLPFGKGKMFLNGSTLANEVLGGFSLGTVVLYQSGYPFNLAGGNDTLNQYDGGVTLVGTTAKALQSQVGVNHVYGHSTSLIFNQNLYSGGAAGGTVNTSVLAPNTTPGTVGSVVWLYSPHIFNQNLALTKAIPIKEGVGASLQAEFINVWNHPNWGAPSGTLQSTSFGTESIYIPSGSSANGARAIELRANIYF